MSGFQRWMLLIGMVLIANSLVIIMLLLFLSGQGSGTGRARLEDIRRAMPIYRDKATGRIEAAPWLKKLIPIEDILTRDEKMSRLYEEIYDEHLAVEGEVKKYIDTRGSAER